MWTQYWVIEDPDEHHAESICKQVLKKWAPPTAEPPTVGPSRFYGGKDDLAIGQQYWQEFQDIQTVVADAPREDWRKRFAELGQRGLGIPPRAGFVVVDHEQPRSARPTDWTKPHGPRWIVSVTWTGDPPQGS
jgi:hypothetical protein